MRAKRFLETAPAVALNNVQTAHVCSTHELLKGYSVLRKFSAFAFKQKSRSATPTRLKPHTDSPEVEGFCDVQLCFHRNSTILGCVFYDANSTSKVQLYILQVLHITLRN
jgi:hypothetical protein